MPLNPKTTLKNFLAGLKLKPGEALLCAVSGGADSLCLLALLHEAGMRVAGLHCNHGLRGRDSERDQKAVEEFCLLRGIPLITFKKRLGKGGALEERARAWRRECYALAAREAGARFIFLGHHAGDQAETLLMNLIRGAGAKGALGMLPLSPLEGSQARLARPFLELEPAKLRAELKRRKIKWREDKSNADTRFARNQLRHRILPMLEKLAPGARKNLAAFTRRAAALGLPGLDDRATQRVRELLKKGSGTVDLKGGMALEASRGALRLKGLIKVENRALQKDWRPETNAFWFSDVKLAAHLKVRGARAGDRMRPFGMQGSRLVFDLLSEAGVPAWKREGWPLLLDTRDKSVLGVLGIRQAEGYRVIAGEKRALRVSWPSFDSP